MSLKKLKDYKSVEEYEAHQKEKTTSARVKSRFARKSGDRERRFKKRFEFAAGYGFVKPGWSALCLGARYGEEVRALKSMGVKAIGCDLVACPPDVVIASMQDLSRWEGQMDMVFTNSLDHALDIGAVFQEVNNTLKHKGFFIVDVYPGEGNVSEYENYQLEIMAILELGYDEMEWEICSLNSKLTPLYPRGHHAETQIVFRKGTRDK